MGTSSSYSGPKRSPLIPSEYADEILLNHSNVSPIDKQSGEDDDKISVENAKDKEKENNETKDSNVPTYWPAVKNAMSKFATGNSTNLKKITSHYVRAYGGSRNASRSARSGIRTTIKLGNFLGAVSNIGIKESLKEANIHYEGKSAQEVLNEIINFIAPIPITKEDSVARKALIVTMEELYILFEEDGKEIKDLDKINKETFNTILLKYIESYIYERIISDLGSRIEKNSSSPADAINKETEIKEYIDSKVETTLSKKNFSIINFTDKKIGQVIENIYVQCYKVMEDML
jgi:hypothetical protein